MITACSDSADRWLAKLRKRGESFCAEYRGKISKTPAPWGGERVVMGRQFAALAGQSAHAHAVMLRSTDTAALRGGLSSAARQALIASREAAADVMLTARET